MGGLKDYSVTDFKELIPPLVNTFYFVSCIFAVN